MRNIKVLFLSRLYYPHIGGVERHVEEVSKGLVEKGQKVVIVIEDYAGNLPEKETYLGTSINRIKLFDYPNWLKKFRIWWWFWKNRGLIEDADIVHAHDVGFWYFPLRFLYLKKPFFVTFHGWEGKYPVPFKNKIIRKINERLALGNICVGDYLAKWYGTKPDYVTYGGVETKLKNVIKNSKLITFIGRLERDTGLPIFLKGFKKLNSKFQIQFLGEGRLKQEAEKVGKVLGFVLDTKPYILQSRFVFTSGYLAILEAMACKRLVFAVYDNPLKEDYLKMTPFAKWIVIEKNPKKLAEKIKYYLNHPQKEKKLVNKAYNWARKQTWNKVVEVYEKLWER